MKPRRNRMQRSGTSSFLDCFFRVSDTDVGNVWPDKADIEPVRGESR
jgi:hypothetical protein